MPSPPSPLSVLPSSPYSGALVRAMPLMTRNARDAARAGARAVTNNMRASLLQAFLSWTDDEAIPWADLMAMAQLYVDEINAVIVRYGRCVYDVGRPYTITTQGQSMRLRQKSHL